MKFLKVAVIIILLGLVGTAYAGIPECEGEGDKIDLELFTLEQNGDQNNLTVMAPAGYDFDAIDVWPALHNGEDLPNDCTQMPGGTWSCQYSELAEGFEEIVVVDLVRGSGTDRCIVAWAKSFVDELLTTAETVTTEETESESEQTVSEEHYSQTGQTEAETTLEEEMQAEEDLTVEAEMRDLGALDANANLMGAGGGSCSLNPANRPNALAIILLAAVTAVVIKFRRYLTSKI